MASIQWSMFVLLAAVTVAITALPTRHAEDGTVRMMEISHAEEDARPLTVVGGYKLSFGPFKQAFEEFKDTHDVYYSSDAEEAYRFSVFKHNVEQMEKHNLLYHQGKSTFYQDVNQFSDKTLNEYHAYNRLGQFSSTMKNAVSAADPPFSICTPYKPTDNSSDPATMDWRQEGKVTHIKNQGSCGSCWAFSATGSTEGSYAITTGSLVSLSEQQIVDCCPYQICQGCGGGFMDTALSYINKTGGIEMEAQYPYTARNGQCHFHRSEATVRVTGCYDVPHMDEDALKNAVAKKGPISVGIDAGSPMFQSYRGGIYYDAACSPTKLDHGVLVVGYGSQGGQDYWIVKNSWGLRWGIHGYIWMARNKNNNCGIATWASFPSTAST